MEKDVVDTTKPAVIDTSSVLALPIVIKIEPPRDAVKQKNDKTEADETNKPTKSRLCQLLPVLLFLVTFATVLTLLIIYMDPSSEFHDSFRINYPGAGSFARAPHRGLRLRSIKVPFREASNLAKSYERRQHVALAGRGWRKKMVH
jgi:hypothetical protein